MEEVLGQSTYTWVGSVSGNNDGSSEKLTGFFHCSPAVNFQTATAQIADRVSYEDVELALTDYYDLSFFSGQLPGIAGFSGNFRGAGEWIKRDRSDSRLKSNTYQNQLYAWFHGYAFNGDAGLVANTHQLSNGSETRSVAVDGGAAEARLIDADQGHCFLEQIGGKFDGRGEEAYVQIRRDPSESDRLFWVLRAESAPDKPVSATAICLDYLQP